MKPIEIFKTKLVSALKSLLSLMLAWLFVLVIITAFELIFSSLTRAVPESIFKFLMRSIWNDLLFWLTIWIYILPIYVLLFFLKPNVARNVTIGILLVISIIQILLIYYFNTALIPLGADLFGYSIADIKITLNASDGLSLWPIISIIVLTFICGRFLFFGVKRIKVSLLAAIIIPILCVVNLIFNFSTLVQLFNQQNEYDSNLAINKVDYFLSSSANYFFPKTVETDIYADGYIQQFEGEERASIAFNYPNEANFPFYHVDEVQDVLTPFFNPIKTPPNIVILLVEGLGRAFTNDGAYLGNFTPFLDSLSGKSLYWKNFLSIGGRTFGVLPSLMGSMPFAKNGMLELGDKMPEHLSLYSLLKYNGYHSSFYYGGDANFDNMSIFLKRNAVDEIQDLKTIPKNYLKLPNSESGFSWGYADDQLFSYYLNANKVISKPELNVILTVATHSPFLINNESKYLQAFEKRMDVLGFDQAKKADYRKFEKQYASIIYADEAIKSFFKTYQKRSDFSNTIFLITGDHRMPEIPLRTKIDRFHVPLIIYSPLLKRTAQIESVSTHFDITPSLLAFLKKNLKMNIPVGSSWMGDGLDTARVFRNIHSYPLIQTKTAMLDFIQGEYHLNGSQLFKLNADLSEVPVQDQDKFNQLNSSFDAFKAKNDQISKGGKLLPDSIINKYRIR